MAIEPWVIVAYCISGGFVLLGFAASIGVRFMQYRSFADGKLFKENFPKSVRYELALLILALLVLFIDIGGMVFLALGLDTHSTPLAYASAVVALAVGTVMVLRPLFIGLRGIMPQLKAFGVTCVRSEHVGRLRMGNPYPMEKVHVDQLDRDVAED